MVYYYQIRNYHHKTEAVPAATCPLCGTRGQLKMSIQQKYTWMIGPMAPSAKYAIAWCEHCNNYIPRVKWTDEMDAEYVRLKQGLKTPARFYRGLWVMPLLLIALVGGIILFVKISSGRHKKDYEFVQQAALRPQVGDIFQVSKSTGQTNVYTYYKVARTGADSVYMLESTQHATDMKNWDEIPTEASAFGPGITSFSLANIQRTDGMFSRSDDEPPVYGIVFGVWREGELHKKY